MLHDNDVARFWSKVNRLDGCWEWKRPLRKDGYANFCLLGKQQLAHRISWIISFGEIPRGLCILHKCDNRKCVNPDHLWTGTRLDNARDMFSKNREVKARGQRHGRTTKPERTARGERHGNTTLTADIVLQIRSMHRKGVIGYGTIAPRFGISRECVADIIKRRVWRHV